MDDIQNEINYCSRCGAKIEKSNHLKDDVSTHMCVNCNAVYYENPKIIVLSLIDYRGKVLLCKRAIKPRLGFWTLPGGYMEKNETVEEAAIRETQEETGVIVNKLHLYTLVNCPKINQVYFVFRGSVNSDYTEAGEECMDAKFFAECDIPWDTLSYKLMNQVLDWFYDDKSNGKYLFRTHDTYEICPD
ncbi:MAG: NUDIX domain-containing protein [Gammaproteobacteria bacterium]|nr:NUDIX domain-containing protein [Gammaproteobacteria bacterium]